MAHAYQEDMTGKKKLSKGKRTVITIFVTLLLLGSGLYGALYILLCGPSAYAGRVFIREVQKVPAAAQVVEWIAGTEKVQAALSRNEDMQQNYVVYPQID